MDHLQNKQSAMEVALPAKSRPIAGKEGDEVLSKEEWDSYHVMTFGDVFVTPVGDMGLEFTPKFTKAEGTAVRFVGHMVRHPHDDPRVFLMTPRPMALMMSEYGLADDLPPWALHVILPEEEGSAPEWRPQLLTVCGVLELGPRQEADGRISHFRLRAEHVAHPESRKKIDLMKPVVFQPERLASGAGLTRPEKNN